MNSALSLNLEAALVAYLAPLCPFAASVTGASDRRHADEEQYGILGQFVPVPAVVVTVSGGSSNSTTNPGLDAEVSVTIRHSRERSTPATHGADAITVADALWSIADTQDSISASEGVTLTGIFQTSEQFTASGRKLETVLNFNSITSSKETES